MRTFYIVVNLALICRHGAVAGECPEGIGDL